jgi:uncharacterized protein (DUF2235 family)
VRTDWEQVGDGSGPVPTSGKSIVLCCDGTGNAYSGTPSNILRTYTWIERGPKQIACYHPGVGTHPLPEGRTRVGRRIRHAKELCVGTGVIPAVVSLYTYLMQHYEHGDTIFLFGFSRGAFTVRALAGMLHVCGLLSRDDLHLISFAAGLYQTSEGRITRERRRRGLPAAFDPAETTDHASLDIEAGDFKSQFGRPCTVRFMGIWDTVKAYGWLYPQSFPALRHNRSVEAVRHAVSLHERRALFKMTGWGDRHEAVKEVWFAGDHSDVGGGHPSGNSPLADASLRWILGEATHAGLRLNAKHRDEIGEMERRSIEAPSTPPHDLWKDGYWFLDHLPRVELFNATYPPKRRPRVLWADGGRTPTDHTEGAPLRVHRSVEQRSAHDSRLSPGRLAGGAPFEIEPDLPILWDASPDP